MRLPLDIKHQKTRGLISLGTDVSLACQCTVDYLNENSWLKKNSELIAAFNLENLPILIASNVHSILRKVLISLFNFFIKNFPTQSEEKSEQRSKILKCLLCF